MRDTLEEFNKIKELCEPGNEYSSWLLAKELFDIPRSVSGDGNLKTLEIIRGKIKSHFDIKFFDKQEYFSWSTPKYWTLNQASITSLNGEVLISTDSNILHVLIHSSAYTGEVDRETLKAHLFIDTDPTAVPYRTTYYKETWGFCVTKAQFDMLMKHEKLKVTIDSTLEDKATPYGEAVFKGGSSNELLITSYICHPAMANNELSGILLIVRLMLSLKELERCKLLPITVRIVLAPETFGAIAYISENIEHLHKVNKGVLVCSCVGDGRMFSLIKGRNPGDFYKALRVSATSVAKQYDINIKEYSFLDRGSDERQYSSPHVDLDVGTFCNSKFGEYPEYHTSLDNLDIISEEAIAISCEVVLRAIFFAGLNQNPTMIAPCEPMFSKYGLYPHTRDYVSTKKMVMDLLNFSAYSDGQHSIVDIAEICDLTDVEAIGLFRKFQEKDVIK